MPSTFFLMADKAQCAKAKRRALLYFVCGNPGLIEYYDDFLECLMSMLRASEICDTAYDMYGRDLLGFRDEDHEPFDDEANKPWDLEGQIEAVYADVAAQRRRDHPELPYDVVIMAGHSVGAYITMEIFSRHGRDGAAKAPHLVLGQGLLLFPTLTHIAESSNGVKLAALDKASALADQAHRLAGWALALFTEGMLSWVIENIMGFTGKAAVTTAHWLKSRDGLRQTIYLGRYEMRLICEDKWKEEVWGTADATRLFMFYAKEDHWVPTKWRDELVEKRRGVARIVVDEKGDLPHAFCTKERPTWQVARVVCGWLEEIDGVGKT